LALRMSHSDKANVQETRGVVRLNLKRDDVRARRAEIFI
jgi:hypothetical protein